MIKYPRASGNKIAETSSRYKPQSFELHENDNNNDQILNMKFEITLALQQQLSNSHHKQNTNPKIYKQHHKIPNITIKYINKICHKNAPRYCILHDNTVPGGLWIHT